MIHLTINDFSCIKKADIRLQPMTLLIGPQASGKSVISKLMYFCIDSLFNYHPHIREVRNTDEYRQQLASRFSEWFPPTTWGEKKFQVKFSIGSFNISVYRSSYRENLTEKFVVRLSKSFTSILEEDLSLYRKQVEKLESESRPMLAYEAMWSVQSSRRKLLVEQLGDEYLEAQLFIPAGRSFFTNLGKAITIFEQGNMLESFTTNFGRFFSGVREFSANSTRIFRRTRNKALSQDIDSLQSEFLESIVGGIPVFERNKEFVKIKDGRMIPFQILSSGQQEALPLVLSVLYYIDYSATGNSMLYIEEPEAHLFPSTQDEVVRMLARIASSDLYRARMMITTHSPYVLTKLNNLIRAGSLGQEASARKLRLLNSIVDSAYWLRPNTVMAYALIEGIATPIITEDGLIDGDYLDSVSESTSEEFSRILEVEFSE